VWRKILKGNKPFKVFVGYDSRENIAYEVAKHSIMKKSTVPVTVIPIKQKELRTKGLYTREIDALASTEFTFTRFLIPHLCNYDGWALFIDCDFLFKADIKKLINQCDDRYAVMCAHHDYTPKEGTKMDGQQQTVYPRKNWSSMVLWNCGHPSNKAVDLELVNDPDTTGAYLHRFSWLDDSEIGEVSHEWNWLVGWYNEPEDGEPKALHYTEGGPWFDEYTDCEYSNDWLQVAISYKDKENRIIRDNLRTEKNRQKQFEEIGFSENLKNHLSNELHKSIDPNFDFFKKMKVDNMTKKPKTIVLSPDPEDFDLEHKNLEFDPVLTNFAYGSQGHITKWDKNIDSNEKTPMVIRGLGGSSQKALKHCRTKGRDFFAVDTGYIQPGTKKEYHRVTKNALQHPGPIIERPFDRLEKLRYKFRPRKKKGETILICPPSEKVMKFYGQDLDKWLKDTIAEISKYSSRQIIVRQKPSRSDRVTTNTIWKAMDEAHVVVTYNSIAATEALLYGCPAIALAPNSATVLCNTKLDQLNDLYMPYEDDIMAFAAHLSYCQFTEIEMRSGYAWEVLNESS